MLELKRLVALREVARLRSFSAAAFELSLTQSAVSQQIAALEKQLGVALLDRGPPIELTVPGMLLVEHTGDALAHLSAGEAAIREFRGLKTGRLRISSFASAASTIMPTALRSFHSLHPNIELTLLQLEPREGIDAVRRGEVDVALFHQYNIEPELGSLLALRRQHLFNEEVMVAMSADHPLAKEHEVELRDLAGDYWVDAPNAGLPLPLLSQTATTGGFKSTARFEGDDFATVLQLVRSGYGLALIPKLAVRHVPEGVVLARVSPNSLVRVVDAVSLSIGINSPATVAILEILGDIGAQLDQRRNGRAAQRRLAEVSVARRSARVRAR